MLFQADGDRLRRARLLCRWFQRRSLFSSFAFVSPRDLAGEPRTSTASSASVLFMPEVAIVQVLILSETVASVGGGSRIPVERVYNFRSAPVAQMDRAIASGAIGREFESLRARQISSCPSVTCGCSDRPPIPSPFSGLTPSIETLAIGTLC